MAWQARAHRTPRQARARRVRASSRLYLSTVYGCIPDLIQFLAVMRSAHKAPAVISNGAFHDAMTSARPARARRAACLEKLYRLIWDTRTRAAWHCIHIMSAVYGCIPDFLLSWSARGRRVCIVTSPLAPNAHMFFIYIYIYIYTYTYTYIKYQLYNISIYVRPCICHLTVPKMTPFERRGKTPNPVLYVVLICVVLLALPLHHMHMWCCIVTYI